MTQTRNRPGATTPRAASEQVCGTDPSLTAGITLRAIDALRDQQTYTRAQVAYLMHLAYESGRTDRYVGDLAELHATWARHPLRRSTAEQRYRDRLAQMATRSGRPEYTGGPVDWDTGRPLRRPQPYTSPANGTTLGVAERDVIGRWSA